MIKPYVHLLCFLFLLTACDEGVTFTEPQPVNSKTIKQFPDELLGEYKNLTGRKRGFFYCDSSRVIIEPKLIRGVFYFGDMFHPKELEEKARIVGDSIYSLNSDDIGLVKEVGDSLLVYWNERDTLFNISKGDLIKKLKRFYFLNKLDNDSTWTVVKLKSSDDNLTFGRISSERERDELKRITGQASDKTKIETFSLTKKQFKKFLKNGGFSHEEVFEKVQTN